MWHLCVVAAGRSGGMSKKRGPLVPQPQSRHGATPCLWPRPANQAGVQWPLGLLEAAGVHLSPRHVESSPSWSPLGPWLAIALFWGCDVGCHRDVPHTLCPFCVFHPYFTPHRRSSRCIINTARHASNRSGGKTALESDVKKGSLYRHVSIPSTGRVSQCNRHGRESPGKAARDPRHHPGESLSRAPAQRKPRRADPERRTGGGPVYPSHFG
jgi:hypothetical protein